MRPPPPVDGGVIVNPVPLLPPKFSELVALSVEPPTGVKVIALKPVHAAVFEVALPVVIAAGDMPAELLAIKIGLDDVPVHANAFEIVVVSPA